MGTTFRTVICTLENMTPDHIRILDHKFLPPDPYHYGGGKVDERANGKTEKMIEGYKRLQCPVQLTSESGCVMIFPSFGEAAEYLGRQQPVISRAISDGYRIKSFVDNTWYTAKKLGR